MTPPLYTAYGLCIASELALPELELAALGEAGSPCATHSNVHGAAADVTILLGPALEPGSFEEACENLYASFEEAVLSFRGVGRFTLQLGRRVLAEPQQGVSELVLRTFLLGPVLATLLFQRGFLVLHASAVALPDSRGELGAVAFLGRSGEGKSTMAASLYARGWPIVADDYIAVPPLPLPTHSAERGESLQRNLLEAAPHPLLFPGYSQLRLWPQSMQALNQQEQGRLRDSTQPASFQKLHCNAAQNFSTRRLPLRRVYVLEAGEEVRALALQPSRSVVELARHSYCTSLLGAAERTAQFQHCGALAGIVPLLSLQRPRDMARLEESARAVEGSERA